LEGYNSPLLTYTEEEKELGLKYVFQTRITKETVNERMRGALDPPLWTKAETFIDNNAQFVMDRLHEYYK